MAVLVLIMSFLTPNFSLAQIQPETLPKLIQANNVVEQLNGVPLAAFDVPVDLDENFGQFPYFKSKRALAGKSQSKVDRYLNAGIARIHTFHHFDSVRCFRQAVTLDPSSTVAKAFLALAYTIYSPTSPETEVLVANLLNELDPTSVNGKERAWHDFIQSYLYARVKNLPSPKIGLSSPQAALRKLLQATDRDVEALTLGEFLVNGAQNDRAFAEALGKKSDHVGAHHYLVHSFESAKVYPLAMDHSKRMAELATDSAHAQHMYGHILPRMKMWTEAEVQFDKADLIHQNWAKKYGYPEYFDWHFSHNLDLMGATYLGLGRSPEAQKAFETACPYDWRACQAFFKMAAVTGDADAIRQFLAKQKVTGEDKKRWEFFLERFLIEADLKNVLATNGERIKRYLETKSDMYEPADSAIRTLLSYRLANRVTVDEETLKKIEKSITFYAQDRLGCASFDGWGKGMLDLVRIWRVANTLGFTNVSESLANLLFNELGVDVTKDTGLSN